MIEYLDPSDWSLKYHRPTDDAVPADWIKVPEGADYLIDTGWSNHFYGDINGVWSWFNGDEWIKGRDKNKEILQRQPVIWTRATHPEELPFIDDEPKQYHDNYHIRPKPRQRVYAVIGE